jgi:hypothetical protein
MTTTINKFSENSAKLNKPEIKFRAGGIAATVWKNQSKEGEYRTVSFERSYKDKEGQWKTTSSLRLNDLPKACVVLNKAFEHLVLSGNEVEEPIVM